MVPVGAGLRKPASGGAFQPTDSAVLPDVIIVPAPRGEHAGVRKRRELGLVKVLVAQATISSATSKAGA